MPGSALELRLRYGTHSLEVALRNTSLPYDGAHAETPSDVEKASLETAVFDLVSGAGALLVFLKA